MGLKEKTSWYQSVELLRQDIDRDWESIINNLADKI